MSIELCSNCNDLIDTDEDAECYIGDTCICAKCREANPAMVHVAELSRDYAKDKP